MYEKAKKKIKNNDKKINAIFVILTIVNILLYSALIRYYLKINLTISFSTINNIITIISAIIILGIISTRLPKFREMGNNSLYEIGYLIIMGLFSITLSYFNESTNGKLLWRPFIDMFKVLSVLLLMTILATKVKSFDEIVNGKRTVKNQILSFIIFGILGILASTYTIDITGMSVNVRSLIIMISGLFGGPFVGIPAGIIAGGWRYMLGGSTALPSAITTIISGFIGSLIYYWNDKKFLGTMKSALLMFLYTGFDMFLIYTLTDNNISIPIINNAYPPMVFAGVLGIVIFSMIIEERKRTDSDDEKDIKQVLEEYDEKIDTLEKEIEKLKKN